MKNQKSKQESLESWKKQAALELCLSKLELKEIKVKNEKLNNLIKLKSGWKLEDCQDAQTETIMYAQATTLLFRETDEYYPNFYNRLGGEWESFYRRLGDNCFVEWRKLNQFCKLIVLDKINTEREIREITIRSFKDLKELIEFFVDEPFYVDKNSVLVNPFREDSLITE